VFTVRQSILTALMLSTLLFGARTACAEHSLAKPPEVAVPPVAADSLETLMTGNQRFVESKTNHPHQTHEQVIAISKAQHPFVAILGCSDSRVPPELIFDQGLGDIFDVRVAGNVVDPTVLGSLEYAVEHLHVPLILVLGHERCGAVEAALAHEHPHNHINAIIRALASPVRQANGSSTAAVKNNVTHVLHQLQSVPVLREHLHNGTLRLAGAYYSLETGKVELLHQ
jgi:carbonic anhydrase